MKRFRSQKKPHYHLGFCRFFDKLIRKLPPEELVYLIETAVLLIFIHPSAAFTYSLLVLLGNIMEYLKVDRVISEDRSNRIFHAAEETLVHSLLGVIKDGGHADIKIEALKQYSRYLRSILVVSPKKPITRNPAVFQIVETVNQTLSVGYGEIFSSKDDEENRFEESNSTLEHKDDYNIGQKAKLSDSIVKNYRDDMSSILKLKRGSEVSQRVVYLLDFAKQLSFSAVDAHRSTPGHRGAINKNTLACFLELYYSVPSGLKSCILVSLLSMAEQDTDLGQHTLLFCFMLKELAADHFQDFRLAEVGSSQQAVSRLCQLCIRKRIGSDEIFFEAAIAAFSIFQLENTLDPRGYLTYAFWDCEISDDRASISLLKTKILIERLYGDFFDCMYTYHYKTRKFSVAKTPTQRIPEGICQGRFAVLLSAGRPTRRIHHGGAQYRDDCQSYVHRLQDHGGPRYYHERTPNRKTCRHRWEILFDLLLERLHFPGIRHPEGIHDLRTKPEGNIFK